MSVQIGTPRVMLTPDREGIEISVVIHEGPAVQDPAAPDFRARRRRARDRAPRRTARAASRCSTRTRATISTARELVKDLQSVRTLYRDAGYANVEAEPETRARPGPQRGRHRHPDSPRSARLRRAHRGEGEHQDARQGPPARDGDPGRGSSSPSRGSTTRKRRITALGYFERVDVSTEQGSSPDKIIINFEVAEKPTGTFQVGAGFSIDRELHRHRADPASQPLRQRPVARAAGAGQRAPTARDAAVLRAVLPRHGLVRSASELFDTLYVFPELLPPHRSAAR